MTIQGGASDAAVLRLMERLFLRGLHRPPGMEPQLLVGELPHGWDIPLPQGAIVVGTHVPMEFHARVVLDVPGQPEEAVAAIEQALTGAGWRSRERLGSRGGGHALEHAESGQGGGGE